MVEAVERVLDDGESVLDSRLVHPRAGLLLDVRSLLEALHSCSCRTVDLEVSDGTATFRSSCGALLIPSSREV